jgi:coenzyme F420-reducing hydrogenase delta subunit
MTVPRSFRRNSEIPSILVLHYEDLPASDVQTCPGYKYTRPLRTILDLIESGEVERNFIRQALTQAVDRDMITLQQIRNAQLTEPTRKIVEAILRQAALWRRSNHTRQREPFEWLSKSASGGDRRMSIRLR